MTIDFSDVVTMAQTQSCFETVVEFCGTTERVPPHRSINSASSLALTQRSHMQPHSRRADDVHAPAHHPVLAVASQRSARKSYKDAVAAHKAATVCFTDAEAWQAWAQTVARGACSCAVCDSRGWPRSCAAAPQALRTLVRASCGHAVCGACLRAWTRTCAPDAGAACNVKCAPHTDADADADAACKGLRARDSGAADTGVCELSARAACCACVVPNCTGWFKRAIPTHVSEVRSRVHDPRHLSSGHRRQAADRSQGLRAFHSPQRAWSACSA